VAGKTNRLLTRSAAFKTRVPPRARAPHDFADDAINNIEITVTVKSSLASAPPSSSSSPFPASVRVHPSSRRACIHNKFVMMPLRTVRIRHLTRITRMSAHGANAEAIRARAIDANYAHRTFPRRARRTRGFARRRRRRARSWETPRGRAPFETIANARRKKRTSIAFATAES
jgi:hypothetical protein